MMKVYCVQIENNGKSVLVEEGTNLLECLQKQGFMDNAVCGGHGSCGKCIVFADGEKVYACKTTVHKDLGVRIPEQTEEKILTDALERKMTADGSDDYIMAFDIGTTTIVGYLLDGHSGEKLYVINSPNPQRAYGADVISRIQYTLTQDSHKLHELIVDKLQEMMSDAADGCGISTEEITLVSVVGNTCMHHLFLNLDVGSLAKIPYMPSVREALEIPAEEFFPTAEGSVLRVLPNIAGFVGADTVGCLIASEYDKIQDWTLLIDIGTNGEMVLGNGARSIACSTAAGPAFEGARIQCGMRGGEGAIDHVFLQGEEIVCSVIGEGTAAGICGSGLIDAVSVLLKMGLINPSGRMQKNEGLQHYYAEGQMGKTVLLKDGVFVTQKDIREVQLAKAAIRAGIELMAREMGIAVSEIKTVYLAGAFGNYLNPDSACDIDLIPPVLRNRIVPIGNAAGVGAICSALMQGEFERSKSLARDTEFLELASLPDFQEHYLYYTNFCLEK